MESVEDVDNVKVPVRQNDLLSLHNAHLEGRHADYAV